LGINDAGKKIQLQAIDFIRDNEDELLTRWLLQKLSHEDADISCASAGAFAHFFDEEEAFVVYQMTSLSPLIRLATSSNKQKQLCAIDALGKSEHYRALQVLTQLLGDNDVDIRLSAISALGLLKEKSIIPFLVTRVNDKNEATPLRAAALIAIKKIDGDVNIAHLLSLKSANDKLVNNKLGIDTSGKDDSLQVLNYAYYHAENNLLIREDLSEFIRHSSQVITEPKSEQKSEPNQNKSQPDESVIHCKKLLGVDTIAPNLATEFFTRCLKVDVFYKELPNALRISLQTDAASRLTLLPLIAPRKERWARALVLSTLRDKQAPLSHKKVLLAHLADTLSVGLLRELEALFTAAPQSDLAPYLAKHLLNNSPNNSLNNPLNNPLNNGDHVLVSPLLEQLQASLSLGDHARSMALAEALIEVAPTAVFERILMPGSQYEH
jgi:hypothetical protein